MKYIQFTNDNNVIIKLFNHKFSNKFITRDRHEVLFRRINTFLINNKYIKGNIIDSGAWIGDNSIPWAKNISNIVFAIDPSSENCKYIENMAVLNSINNIKIIESALSDKNEILYTDDDITHCSFLNNHEGSKTSALATTLDELFKNNIIYDIDYIHLDVEFMEFKVISGSLELIKKYYPIITFEQHIEIEDYMLICNLLKIHGYCTYIINEILPGCRTDCRNFISFPPHINSIKIKEEIETHLNSSNLLLII